MNRSSSLRNCLAASSAALVLLSTNSFGADVYARLDGNWDSAIWSLTAGGTVDPILRPGSNDLARLNAGMDVIVNSPVATVNGITLQGGGASSLTLNSGAALTVSGASGAVSFNTDGGTRTVTLNAGSSMSVTGNWNQANAINTTTTTVNTGGSLATSGIRVAQTGTGYLTVAGGSVRITGSNANTASIVGSSGIGTLTINSGGQFVSEIDFAFTGGNSAGRGNLDLQNGTMVVRGALLRGNGTVNMSWSGGNLSVRTTDLTAINNNGTGVFAPGEIGSVGSFSLATGATTTYTQGANAAMNLDFASNASFDTVSIGAGTSLVVNLNGTIVLNLIGAYVPTEGLTFDVITATDIVDNGFVLGGNGASYFTHQIITSGGTDILRLTAVPEPSTYALLAAVGVIGMALRRRRR